MCAYVMILARAHPFRLQVIPAAINIMSSAESLAGKRWTLGAWWRPPIDRYLRKSPSDMRISLK